MKLANRAPQAFSLMVPSAYAPGVFRTIAKMRIQSLVADERIIAVDAEGSPTGQEGSEAIRDWTLSGDFRPCRISFSDGSRLDRCVMITRFGYEPLPSQDARIELRLEWFRGRATKEMTGE